MATAALAVSGASWAVLMSVSPLLQIRPMVGHRSSEELSLGSFAVLVAGFALWIAYGIASRNAALVVPNAIALVAGVLTIAVAARLRRS